MVGVFAECLSRRSSANTSLVRPVMGFTKSSMQTCSSRTLASSQANQWLLATVRGATPVQHHHPIDPPARSRAAAAQILVPWSRRKYSTTFLLKAELHRRWPRRHGRRRGRAEVAGQCGSCRHARAPGAHEVRRKARNLLRAAARRPVVVSSPPGRQSRSNRTNMRIKTQVSGVSRESNGRETRKEEGTDRGCRGFR